MILIRHYIKKAGIDSGKVHLTKLSWFVPHVMPTDLPKMQLYKLIEDKTKIQAGFRSRKCYKISVPTSTDFSWRVSVQTSPEKSRYILVALQSGRKNDQTANPSIFNNVDLKSIVVNLDSKQYPTDPYNLSFKELKISRAYNDAKDFKDKFYGLNNLVSDIDITSMEYKLLYPIFVVDVSKQSERLKNSVTDITIEAKFNTPVPANTVAYAVIISDKILSFESDGSKMSVIQS